MSWSSESYFAKAQIYWTRATYRGRENDEFVLYLCFTLEFISRGALCSISPALNAASDLESLYFACGQEARTPPKSIEMSEVIKRIQRLIPGLTDSEIANVKAIFDARNGELHSDKSEISNLNSSSLMPKVYSFIVKVTEFSNQNLDTLLGNEDAKSAKNIANAMMKDRSKRVQDLIRICKERFFALSDSQQSELRANAQTEIMSVVLKTGHHIMYIKCPACSQSGQLLATPVGRSAAFLRGSELVQEVRVIPFQYSCKCCELKISGLDELMAAGFSHEYCSIDEVDPLEHFNIDPHDYVDSDAIAREYHRDFYEYQDE